jgi:hypothetical protein
VRTTVEREDLEVDLTIAQMQEVAARLNVPLVDVSRVISGINDVLLGDPPQTIRLRPDGEWIAVRIPSVTHPYEVMCISGRGGGCTTATDYILKWPVIYNPRGTNG